MKSGQNTNQLSYI